MQVVRVYSDQQGESHVEGLDVPLLDSPYGQISELVPVSGVIFRETPSGGELDFHNARVHAGSLSRHRPHMPALRSGRGPSLPRSAWRSAACSSSPDAGRHHSYGSTRRQPGGGREPGQISVRRPSRGACVAVSHPVASARGSMRGLSSVRFRLRGDRVRCVRASSDAATAQEGAGATKSAPTRNRSAR